MKRLLQWIALTALVICTPSCGIPQLLGRTVSNTVSNVSDFTGSVMDSAY